MATTATASTQQRLGVSRTQSRKASFSGSSIPEPSQTSTNDGTLQYRSSGTSHADTSGSVEENDAERINRLGRERPPQFRTLWSEVAFCYSIVASQMMAEFFVSGFNVLVPTLMKDLSIPPSASVWPSAAFALVTSAFLLPFGRLADMYGGYPVYMFGLIWFCLWTFVAGFVKDEITLNICRAMQGLGPAAFLPSGTGLLGVVYRPGPRKNLVFSIYGGAAPLGFFFGVLVAGISGSLLKFGWYFWIGAALILSTAVAALFAVPSDATRQKKSEMDWLGAVLLVSGLIALVFGITDGSHAPNKWATPYIYSMLILGILCLAALFYVEGWVAKNPLLPFQMFRIPYIKPLFLGCFFSYGSLGIFMLYSTLYMHDIMGATPVQIAAWYTPMALGGVMLSLLGGYTLHLVPGTYLILFSSLGWILSSLLFAFAPQGANFWAYVLPAMIGATIGIDITFNVVNIFITTNLSTRQQGLAGGVMNTLLYLSIAILLAFADIVQTETLKQGLKESYKNVFFFMLACAGMSLYVSSHFVRIPKASSDLTADEREALLSSSQSMELQSRS